MNLGSNLRARRLLGKGGTASVFEADDLALKQVVAVKVPTSQTGSPGQARARLLREAEAYARIADTRLPRIYRLEELPDETPAMVMEMIRGCTLRTLLDEHGRLPIAMACRLIIELLRILERVHACGLLHRDIKPSNILIEDDPNLARSIRLIDFGICKEMANLDATVITRGGEVVGTPAYMAAEQLRGMPLDQRVDVYATGAMLFELLTGSPPHGRLCYAEMIAAVLRDEPPCVRVFRSDVSPALSAVIARALGKWPWMRYDSVLSFRSALELALGREAVVRPGDLGAPVRSRAVASERDTTLLLAHRHVQCAVDFARST